MPTILLKKSDTPGSVPGTANLTNLAGGVEVAVNTADKRMYSMTSASAVIELGTNPSSLTCADASFTLMKAASASITNLTLTSLVISNLSIASANITTLTSASATITNLLGTTLTISGNSFLATSSGNVGIGTSSPAAKFHTQQAGSAGVVVGAYLAASGNGGSGRGTGLLFGAPGSSSVVDVARIDGLQNTAAATANDAALVFNVANTSGTLTERLRIDSAGNLGLGVTPSAWYTLSTVFQSNGYAFEGRSGTPDYSAYWTNAYLNAAGSAFIYRSNGYASGYLQASGVHRWRTAASGTAGGTISFTETMTLDASGRLGIGTTSPANLLSVETTSGSGRQDIARFLAGGNSNGNGASIAIGSTQTQCGYITGLQTASNEGVLAFGVQSSGAYAERARITSGGDFCIGRTTANGRLHVEGATAGAQVKISGGFQQGLEFRSQNNNAGMLIGRGYNSDDVNDFFIYDTANSALRVFISTDGEVRIAAQADQGAYNLQVNGTGVWAAGAYVNGSDARLKDNIQSLDSGLDVVKAMRPVTFQYKPEHSKDQSVQPGFIAQELQQAMAGKPYLEGVVQAGPEYLNVAYQNIIPILVKAIQELEAKIAALEAK